MRARFGSRELGTRIGALPSTQTHMAQSCDGAVLFTCMPLSTGNPFCSFANEVTSPAPVGALEVQHAAIGCVVFNFNFAIEYLRNIFPRSGRPSRTPLAKRERPSPLPRRWRPPSGRPGQSLINPRCHGGAGPSRIQGGDQRPRLGAAGRSAVCALLRPCARTRCACACARTRFPPPPGASRCVAPHSDAQLLPL